VEKGSPILAWVTTERTREQVFKQSKHRRAGKVDRKGKKICRKAEQKRTNGLAKRGTSGERTNISSRHQKKTKQQEENKEMMKGSTETGEKKKPVPVWEGGQWAP